MNKLIVISAVIAASIISAGAETLKVRHDHNPWGKCTGELILTEDGIEYSTDREKDRRRWKWVDIQTFDRRSATDFSVLTYEDRWLSFGADLHFNFTILPGEEPLSESTFQWIASRLGRSRPLTDRIPRQIDAEYEVPVKHLHTFGGCQGTLFFSDKWIVYRTDHTRDARTWSRDREVESVWSLNRYQLEIHVFEEHRGAFDKTRRFRFQLKEPLDEAYYRRLRRGLLPGR